MSTPVPPLAPLTEAERHELLRIARSAIGNLFGHTSEITPRLDNPALLAPTGAFVSLYSAGALRGCVGHLFPDDPLHDTVAAAARAAASEDLRFAPLRAEEWAAVEIEISRLTPPRPTTVDAIIPGRHGLYVARGPQRGLLLPQVALRYGWNGRQFVRETCRKAGLEDDGWDDPATQLFVFEAEVFCG